MDVDVQVHESAGLRRLDLGVSAFSQGDGYRGVTLPSCCTVRRQRIVVKDINVALP